VAGERGEMVVAGHICLDIIPTFERSASSLAEILVPGKLVHIGGAVTATGGAVSNTGLALHRLGFPTRLMGKVGDDLFGHAVLEILRGRHPALAEGMLITKEAPTSYTVVINPPGVDRMFLHCPGANDTFGWRDIPYEELARAWLFHFGYPPLMRRMYANGGAELERLLRRVKELGVTTSLDMAKPDPASAAGKADWLEVLRRALPSVDVFVPSVDEILFMLDRERHDAMGPDLSGHLEGSLLSELSERLLGMGTRIVALKLGAEGLYLRTTDRITRLAGMGSCAPQGVRRWVGRELLAPCFEVEVVGTTGSGDCTIAGFLAGLAEGLGPEEAVTSAVAVGACNVEQADATSGIPGWGEVQQRLRSEWNRRPTTVSLPGWEWDGESGVWRGPGDAR
jgi:sugar/nucleoside kinase (ribokinase family)